MTMFQFANSPLPQSQISSSMFTNATSTPTTNTSSQETGIQYPAISRTPSNDDIAHQLYRLNSTDSAHSQSLQSPALSQLASLAADASAAAAQVERYVARSSAAMRRWQRICDGFQGLGPAKSHEHRNIVASVAFNNHEHA